MTRKAYATQSQRDPVSPDVSVSAILAGHGSACYRDYWAVSQPAIAVRQAFCCHQLSEPRLRGVDVEVAAGKELLQRQAVFRRIGMQRKMRNLQPDVVLRPKSFCTDRTEVAPRSDVIGEHFKRHLIHDIVSDIQRYL